MFMAHVTLGRLVCFGLPKRPQTRSCIGMTCVAVDQHEVDGGRHRCVAPKAAKTAAGLTGGV